MTADGVADGSAVWQPSLGPRELNGLIGESSHDGPSAQAYGRHIDRTGGGSPGEPSSAARQVRAPDGGLASSDHPAIQKQRFTTSSEPAINVTSDFERTPC